MRDLIVRWRRSLVVAVHLVLWTIAYWGSFLLRFEFDIPSVHVSPAGKALVVILLVQSLVHWRLGLFHGLWRYSSTRDLVSLVKASSISTGILGGIWVLAGQPYGFPRSVAILFWLLSITLVGGVRFATRTVREVAIQSATPKSAIERRRILVLGAGDAGEMLMRDIVRSHGRRYEPVGFLDDNSAKQGALIHDVPVLGPLSRVAEIAESARVDEIILAIPSMRGRDLRKIIEACRPSGAAIRTLPAVEKLIDGEVTVNQLHDVKIEDLLGREAVKLDLDALSELLEDHVVLVTGAGGSIGSELCRQICRFRPKKLLLVDQAENNLFVVDRALRAEHPDIECVPFVADICDSRRLEAIFQREAPQIVFHAAAHKHVPMMESNPGEAIKNNVFGTKKVADQADRFRVKAFVMVSTDKAVNPTSIMGVSKRVAEIYVQALSQQSHTRFVTVRFGNVLGSAGSVVPIFQEQIAAGGPVTVTHPEMTRYFMTIPEACQLVLQAGAMGKGGQIMILDMGQPVKVVDLARDLIRLSGLVPDKDIEIVFSGIRHGEKLFEELSVGAENATKTEHPKIFIGTFKPYEQDVVDRGLARLLECTDGADVMRVRGVFKEIVPEFRAGPGLASTEADATPEPPAVSAESARAHALAVSEEGPIGLATGDRASAPAA